MSIPKILHNIWVGPNEFPLEYFTFLEVFKSLHPDWQVVEWREETLLTHKTFHPAVYEKLRVPAERADILRLEILLKFGGVYLDSDIKVIRNLDKLLELGEFLLCEHKPQGRVNNAFIASIPEHPILKLAVENIRPTEIFGLNKEGTGPLLLEKIVQNFSYVKLPHQTFHSTEVDSSIRYGIDYAALSWKSEQDLRIDNKKLRLNIAKLSDENRKLKARIEKDIFCVRLKRFVRRWSKSIKGLVKFIKRKIRHRYAKYLLDKHKNQVITGPFKGLILPNNFVASNSALAPKILGSYESRVLSIVWEHLQKNSLFTKTRVVVLGSAEGWLACGIARSPNVVSVDTFEEQSAIRPKEREIFLLNGVAQKLTQHGRFDDPLQLIETLDLGSDEQRILLCDIEGHESVFVSYLASQILNSFSLVVIEVHDHVVENIGNKLSEILRLTHDVSIIYQEAQFPPISIVKNFLGSEERNEKRLNYWVVGKKQKYTNADALDQCSGTVP